MDIDRRIRAEEFPSVPELAADWEVDERTIKRDIEFMRDRLQAPIEYDRKRRGYFYSEPTWGLPAISMREGELVAVLLARRALEQYEGLPLGEMLSHFYSQLLKTAGQQVGVSAATIFDRFSFVPPPSLPVDAGIWDTLVQCLLNSHSVEIEYLSASATQQRTYQMDPLHVANIEGEWYLFAHSHYKGDVMQLAICRIRKAEDSGKTFQCSETWGSEELKQLLFGRYASMQGESEEIRISVDSAYASQIHLKQWHAQQKVTEQPDGSIEISFPVSSGGSKQPYANVIGWVLGMGSHAKVIAPAKLKRLVKKEIADMLATY
ncbi:WYL domain-containing protein [Pontiellaceae bacterium B12227]|nr:WYL domain-containing protein [Pontiellaceae bacterium B12227]